METWAIVKDDNVLCHYGVKGMKWDVRKRRRNAASSAANNEMAKEFARRRQADQKSTARREMTERQRRSALLTAGNEASKSAALRSRNGKKYVLGTEATKNGNIVRVFRDTAAEQRQAKQEETAKRQKRGRRAANNQALNQQLHLIQTRKLVESIHKKHRTAKAAMAKAKNEIAKGRKFIEKAMNATRQERLKREATRGAYGDSKPLRPVSLSEPFKTKRKKR